MFKVLYRNLTAKPSAAVLADAICDAANSVCTTAPIGNRVFGSNGIEIRAGVDKGGLGWLEISGNVIRTLCKRWFIDKPIDTDFQEEVRKCLNEREQSASVKSVEIDRVTWTVKIITSYAQE